MGLQHSSAVINVKFLRTAAVYLQTPHMSHFSLLGVGDMKRELCLPTHVYNLTPKHHHYTHETDPDLLI